MGVNVHYYVQTSDYCMVSACGLLYFFGARKMLSKTL